MMSHFIKSVVFFGVLCVVNSTLQADSPQSVSYKNQRGSVLALTMQEKGNKSGTITGTFTTAVGDCQAEVAKPMAISGFYSGNALTLAVNYPLCKKAIAMTGHLSDDKKGLQTLWLVAQDSPDPNGKNWNANIVGADTYNKIS